jgi:hypothetical protein
MECSSIDQPQRCDLFWVFERPEDECGRLVAAVVSAFFAPLRHFQQGSTNKHIGSHRSAQPRACIHGRAQAAIFTTRVDFGVSEILD